MRKVWHGFMKRMRQAGLLLAILVGYVSTAWSDQPGPGWVFGKTQSMSSFYRGNTHTHTERSVDTASNRASVQMVLTWYRDAGYNFLVVTDHDISATPGEFVGWETDSYIVMAGEEVSSAGILPIKQDLRPVHVNSLCSNGTTVGGQEYASTREALEDSVNRIISQSEGLPQINHPKWGGTLFWDDFTNSAPGVRVFEVANQHPLVQNWEGAWGTSEELWDLVLSSGQTMYGVASDDTHDVTAQSYSPPGVGWVQVAAPELTPTAICAALEAGDFYASTGVEVAQITVEPTRLLLTIEPGSGETGADFLTTFIGTGGQVLAQQSGLSPEFDISSDHGYVRANIEGPNGNAWIQPEFIVPDVDGDGIADSEDNCIEVPNGPLSPDSGDHSQRDTDNDLYGNACDPDFNGNGIVDAADFSLLKARFGRPGFPDQDLNGNGIVDPADFSYLKSNFGQSPGPSGLVP